MKRRRSRTFSRPDRFLSDLGPLQQDEIDIGEEAPARCLKSGLWLARQGGVPFAVLLTPSLAHGRAMGVHVEIVVRAGEQCAHTSEELFRDLEVRVAAGRTYRGRVLSLESYDAYSGRGGAVKVHRLHRVTRDDVILPAETLALLDRNVSRFVAARDHIKGPALLRDLPAPARRTRSTTSLGAARAHDTPHYVGAGDLPG